MNEEVVIRKYSPLCNILMIFFVSITIYSVGFNYYLENKLKSYMLVSEDILKRYEKVSEDLKNFEYKLSFMLNLRDSIDVLRKFAGWYEDDILKDIAFAIVEESMKNNIDPLFMLAIVKTESSFINSSVSSKGAMGLMQILPDTAYYISEKVADIDLKNRKELFDPVINVRLGVNYFAYLMNKFKDEKLSTIAYNFGPSNLKLYIQEGRNIPTFYYYKVMDSYNDILIQSGRT